jgi:predicted MPP superfamily phosphohydrolase
MASDSPSFSQRITRRRLLQTGLLGAVGLALYAGEIERHWVEVTKTEVHLAGLPAAFEGLQIVQLSDIHLDGYSEPYFLRHVVAQVNQLRPDLVMLTGDFVSEGPGPSKFNIGAAWQCANILTGLDCKQMYAVLGNHDIVVGMDEVTEALVKNGIPVLNNSHLPIERDGARIWLAGLGDPLTGHGKPELTIPDSIRHVPGEPVVLLCHEPDYADNLLKHPVGHAVSLMLSGHTHGGQVRLPFCGPLMLPGLGKKYIQGWFRFGSHAEALQLYVNRGIGTVGAPFRFDCPPEITSITLRRA